MDDQRLDKWLWCSRFFRTRSIAQAAIKAGRISVNGEPAKPARGLAPGDRVTVRHPPFTYEVVVIGLSKQRVGAALVPTLYQEDAASTERRQHLAAQLRLSAIAEQLPPGGLDKRARRDRVALKRNNLARADEEEDDSDNRR